MTKPFRCDLHVHTNFSFDNQPFNTMQANAISAIEKGIDVLCFTDHIECGSFNTFSTFPFDEHRREFERVKKQFEGQIKLLIGFEMESPHHHPKELAFLRSLGVDMIIGSVHYPCDYNNIVGRISSKEYEKLYNTEVRKMVEFGGFDVAGHIDMPKKYHHGYKPDLDYIFRTLDICAKGGIVPEMNTSSLRKTDKPCITDESMISVECARYYATVGGKYVTVNSDSHNFETLCADFDNTYAQVEDALCLCYFEQGKLIPTK